MTHAIYPNPPKFTFCDICKKITLRPFKSHTPSGDKVTICTKQCFIRMLDAFSNAQKQHTAKKITKDDTYMEHTKK